MALTWVEKGTLKGPQGERGPQGPAGADGAPGAGFRQCSVDLTANADVSVGNITPSDGIRVGDMLVDPQGDVWEVASIGEGTVHTAASSALNIRGPQGETGPAGADGQDGTGVNIKGAVESSGQLPPDGEPGDAYVTSDTGNLWVWDEESSAFVDTGAQVKGPKGDQGEPGAAATVSVGTTMTGEAGSQAQVTESGTAQARVLNFVIPQGAKGDTGAAGPGIEFGHGAPASTGQSGACYVDVDTWNVYSYEDTEA